MLGTVGVVGGGIGGLTAALALLRAGFDVQVYEQASALGEVGAGVQVSPNASRVLHGLGLAEDAGARRGEAAGLAPAALGRRPDAAAHAAGRAAGGGVRLPALPDAPRRPAAALARALPAERVHLGHRLTGLTDHGDRVEARFADGGRAEVDVLVGADGIHSLGAPAAVRAGRPALHRLRRLPRAGAGRAAARARAGGDGAGLDGARAGTSCTTSSAAGGWSTSSPSSSRTRGRASRGPTAGDARRRAGRVRRLASAGPRDPRRGRRDVRLGAVRPHAARPLVGRAGHPARRRLPRDAAVHGPGRRAGDRGRRDAGGLPGGGRPDVARRAAPLRASCGCRAPPASRRCRRATRRASTCPTGRSSAERDAEMAAGATDWSFKAVAWIYEHDAAAVTVSA